jgi:hypothetical protein
LEEEISPGQDLDPLPRHPGWRPTIKEGGGYPLDAREVAAPGLRMPVIDQQNGLDLTILKSFEGTEEAAKIVQPSQPSPRIAG